MFKCDINQFDKNELVRILLYKTFDVLNDFGIKKIIAKSATYEVDTSNYNSVSSLSNAFVQRDFDVIEIYKENSLYAINTDSVESIAVSGNLIKISLRGESSNELCLHRC